MSIIVNPTIKNEIGQIQEISFSFPIPDLTQPHFQWNNQPVIVVDGSNGTSFIYPDSPVFPGFGSSGTNFISEIFENEAFIFSSDVPFKEIKKWLSYKELIIGDTDFLSLNKQFRVTYDKITWSDWYDLNLDKLNELTSDLSEVRLEFKYVCTRIDKSFSTIIPLNKPYKVGWDKVSSGTNGYYNFDRDYPTQGKLTFKIGDLVLGNNSIRFGEKVQTATQIPKAGDFIFLNPLFQGLELTGTEQLEILFEERILNEGYQQRLYLQNLSLYAEQIEIKTDTVFNLTQIGETVILRPPFLMKAFKITGYQLSTNGETDNRQLEIKFRYSANQKKWSNWEPLTQANVSTIKPDILSFFYIEIAFRRIGTDISGSISLNDLVFEGDIQNVTADYEKINKFGLRPDCLYNKTCECTSCGCNDDEAEKGGTDYCPIDKLPNEWTDPNCSGTFNPYEMYKNIGLANKLANDVTNIYGWDVTYYKTDPDGGGKDKFLHEYQLFNIVSEKDIKVIPSENKFPESMLVMNGFDFSLLENFEIHITKDEFAKHFGIGQRPAKKDRVWFCQMNKLYEVEHAQAYKDFMNASFYYKVKLKPASNDMAIGNTLETSLGDLMKNNSIDALFGDSNQEEVNKIANAEYNYNLTEDKVRLSLKAPILDFELQNASNIIAKNFYSLGNFTDRTALIYEKIDKAIVEGENRAFLCWFNLNEKKTGQNYNFIDNKNPTSGKGYTISFKDEQLVMEWNDLYYEIPVNLIANKWYGIIINFNQRQHKLQWNIYERYSDTTAGSVTSIDLKSVGGGEEELTPQSWNDELILQVIGSPMYYTNMRLFSTEIPFDKHSRALNQYKITDRKNLIIADNCNKKVIAPSHKF